MAQIDTPPQPRPAQRPGEAPDQPPSAGPAGRLPSVAATLAAPWVREPLAVFLLTRVLFLGLTYFGVILFNSVLHGPHPSFLHQLLPAWNNPHSHGWDTEWYIDIAQRGYAWKKAVGTSPAAFFPLYPLLIRIGVILTHRSYFSVALVVSNLAFLAALIYLWRLAAWEVNGQASLYPAAVAGRTILYIATFPTALFFFAGYTESLFLLLTVASFYHLRREDWLLAGTFGALASATRVTGVLLLLPLAYQYWRSRNFSPRRIDAGASGLLLVPLGLIAFMAYLAWSVHDALAFTHDQAAWQKISTLRLWAGILESVRQILVVQPPASFFEAHNVINLGLGGLFLVLSVYAARRLSAAYGLYLLAFWLVTLSEPAMAGGYPVPLISLSRYILSLFPVFMYLGMLGGQPGSKSDQPVSSSGQPVSSWRRGVHDAYLVLSVGMLSLLTIQFINGGWVI